MYRMLQLRFRPTTQREPWRDVCTVERACHRRREVHALADLANEPVEALEQVRACPRRARQDTERVRAQGIEIKSLVDELGRASLERTALICSTDMEPAMSCLLARTSKLAPTSRCTSQQARGHERRASSCSSDASSVLQSLMRATSLESTTQTSASVRSK